MDLHILPKLRDSLSYLYIEHAVIERKDNALLVLQETGRTVIPIANLCVLMLGPGTSLTHAAVDILSEHGCSITWTGQDGLLFYAQGIGETHRASHLLHQAEMLCDPQKHLGVVIRMYEMRFGRTLEPDLTIDQLRGMEGARMRVAYAEASRSFGVEWNGRNYDPKNWNRGDPINRALSVANSVLNGVCHAAIVSGGYSPGLGFLHTGKQLSFVYDVADLYKTWLTIPIAFGVVARDPSMVDSRTRQICRERFHEEKLLQKILPDIDKLLQIPTDEDTDYPGEDIPLDNALWKPESEKE